MTSPEPEFQVGLSKARCLPFATTTTQTGVVECSVCHVASVAGMEKHQFGSGDARPVCPICHCCAHLDVAGQKAAGIMIWLPEIPQAQLNAMLTTMFAAMTISNSKPQTEEDPEIKQMLILYRTFESRVQQVEALFGNANLLFDATSPLFLAQQIEQAEMALAKKLTPAEFSARLDGLRFLAQPNQFKPFIKGAAKVLARRYPRASWAALIEPDMPEEASMSAEHD